MIMLPALRPTRRPQTAFTLVEIMVVVVIMAIMASLTIPRMLGNETREYQLAADRVADLLMMFAQREGLGARPVGLWEDTQNRRLVLMMRPRESDNPDGTLGEASAWVPDRTVRPVPMPRTVSIIDVQADGERVDISSWPLQVDPGETRPDIAIMLEGPSGVRTIVLPGHALSPMQISGANYAEWLGGPIDLDAAGQDREDW
jgi:prepilin-type N-terminal cleavage/methylation domain-containing protein